MATKRMFSLNIVDTDAFLDMPQNSQLLYFHLAMRADDEGFIGNPKRIMRMLGSNDDDIKILVAKKFILPFQSGVCVIKHWLIHNTIRMDRFSPTTYRLEKSKLTLKENRAYKLGENGELDSWQPLGNQMETQVKLSKVKLIEDSKTEASSVPYSFKEEIQKLEDSPRRDLNIIGLYFSERKPDLKNQPQFVVALKRHLRAAKELTPFTDNQILDAIPKAKRITPDWTLETLVKILCK